MPAHHTRLPYRPRIVAETGDYLVVDKPPFLEAHPSKPGGAWTLWDELRQLLSYEIANGGQVSIANRLDRETSGLTFVAKTREAARKFCGSIQSRQAEKEYMAIVWGWPERDSWTVDAPILRLGSIEPFRIYLKRGVHADGDPARTRFSVLRRFEKTTSAGSRFALVQAIPETGRTHQIRVHLAHSGHSIVGDKIYGPDEGCYLEFIDTGWTASLQSRLLLPRHALHASGLAFGVHGLAWKSPLPNDIASFAET